MGKAACMQMGATRACVGGGGIESRAHQTHIHFVHHWGGEKGLCCQRYEMIFVLQITHSLRSGRPIVGCLSSVGVAGVSRQPRARLELHGKLR